MCFCDNMHIDFYSLKSYTVKVIWRRFTETLMKGAATMILTSEKNIIAASSFFAFIQVRYAGRYYDALTR